jgi:hypothetical protein
MNILQLGFLPKTLPIIAEEEEHHFRGQSLIESVSGGRVEEEEYVRQSRQQQR